MLGAPEGFWGKLDRVGDDPPVAWHPLADHAADVGACCAALLEQRVLRQALARLAGRDELDQAQIDRLCVLAALHDAGKFNLGFQAKAGPRGARTAGHVREALALFGSGCAEAERFARAIGYDEIALWGEGDAASSLLIAALAHHGRPWPLGLGHDPAIWRRRGDLDPWAGLAELARRTMAWFPCAYVPHGASLPASPALQHGFSGLVTLADWLASDRKFFPFSEGGEDRWPVASARAREVIARLGIDAGAARASLGIGRPGFERVSEHSPRSAQVALLDLPVPERGSITVLEAETGSGKTEAALGRFLVLLQAGVVDGLYFALPTRTAATQIHRRVFDAVARAFPDPAARPPVVLAVPGYLVVDDQEAMRLAPFEVLWNDEADARWRYRGWAAERPKRYLAGAVVVGTVDQVLLSALAVPHAHLRATALLRHLLVVDEVHASDAYMNRLLERVLSRHLAAGGHALLISATLGAVARARLTRPERQPSEPTLTEARATPYPCLAVRNGGAMATTRGIETTGAGKSVQLQPRPIAADAGAVARAALDAARAGGRIIVLRNTVRDCLATQVALETLAAEDERLLFGCAGVPAPHHARFATEDRRLLDSALERRFGRNAPRGGCVAVATQTVQQSLDLDADRLVTDLCPVDVLLQRIGRLHRHRQERAAGFDEARVELLVPVERDLGALIGRHGTVRGVHGLGTVYEDLRVLEATWRLVEELPRWTIPADNRELVEAATHPEALRAITAALKGPWPAHEQQVEGRRLAHTAHGAAQLVDWSRPLEDQPFPDDLAIATRLGEHDRIAVFDPPLPGPFGQPVGGVSIPAYLVRGVPGKAAPAITRCAERCIEFSLGAEKFIYDRLGLRPAAEPESATEDVADG
ncbi:MAG TPA: CRISPR-associated helicase Cas3' [Polyangia bacterium]|jgi:CRISPR-associated endonuclease/helicase Cas3